MKKLISDVSPQGCSLVALFALLPDSVLEQLEKGEITPDEVKALGEKMEKERVLQWCPLFY